jgi:DNA-directed RNA polymerase subunit RPC12/RpoP
MSSIYICQDCENRFSEMEQNRSDHRDGLCPFCGSEDIRDEEDCLSEHKEETEGIEYAEEQCEAIEASQSP